jgi:two-component sensor histidine kinase
VKNTLATVQAVASSTGRSAATVHDFQAALTGRIGSLAKAHAAITGDETQSASVGELLRLELDGFSEVRAGRVTMSGPDVRLASEIAIPLGLAIHELAVNSAQFGAFSTLSGRVSVSWDYDAAHTLFLSWVEHDGPTVQGPSRNGFGTRVLERVLGGQLGVNVDVGVSPGRAARVDHPTYRNRSPVRPSGVRRAELLPRPPRPWECLPRRGWPGGLNSSHRHEAAKR